MKIAILGAGAMGSLFGGYLSQKNEVCLIEINHTPLYIKGLDSSPVRAYAIEGLAEYS